MRWEQRASAFSAGLGDPSHLYFVHSYYPDVEDPSLIACSTDYGVSFASGIVKKNLIAVQFHPEKSQDVGLRLLGNAVAHFE